MSLANVAWLVGSACACLGCYVAGVGVGAKLYKKEVRKWWRERADAAAADAARFMADMSRYLTQRSKTRSSKTLSEKGGKL